MNQHDLRAASYIANVSLYNLEMWTSIDNGDDDDVGDDCYKRCV